MIWYLTLKSLVLHTNNIFRKTICLNQLSLVSTQSLFNKLRYSCLAVAIKGRSVSLCLSTDSLSKTNANTLWVLRASLLLLHLYQLRNPNWFSVHQGMVRNECPLLCERSRKAIDYSIRGEPNKLWRTREGDWRRVRTTFLIMLGWRIDTINDMHL